MSSGRTAEQLALSVLQRWLDDLRPCERGVRSADVCGRVRDVEVWVCVKSIPAARVDALIGKLAEGVLVARVEALDAVPLVAVVAPRLGPKSLRAAERFMSTYAPHVGWGALDEYGTVRLSVPALQLDVNERGLREPSVRGHVVRRPFSDLNRWLAKVLLDASKARQPRTAADLSAVAAVSRSKAYTFVRDFNALGYIDERMRFRDLPSLLEDWLHEDRVVPAPRVFAKGMFGPIHAQDLVGEGRVLGGFAACKHHGLLHAPFELPELHVREVEVALDALGAGRCGRRDAEVAFIVSSFPESVFRGASDDIVDRWQAALDVVAHPARGLEQAELVRERILAERNE